MTEIAWPLPISSLSPSSINKFQRCAEQWRRQYLLGQWDPPSASSVVGSAVHASAQVNYQYKARTGIDLTANDIDLAYLEAFDQEIEDAGGPREIDWHMRLGKDRVNLSPSLAKDRGGPLARVYHQDIARNVQPVAAEEWFSIEVPGVPVRVRGKIDLITPSEKTDIKFGASAKKKPEASWQLQANTYMLADATTDRDGNVRVGNIGHLPFTWHTGSWGGVRSAPKVLTPDNSPELRMHRTERMARVTQAMIRATADSMIAYYTQFGADNPWPTTALQHTWACNYCTFHPGHGGNCFWWTGGAEEVVTL